MFFVVDISRLNDTSSACVSPFDGENFKDSLKIVLTFLVASLKNSGKATAKKKTREITRLTDTEIHLLRFMFAD